MLIRFITSKYPFSPDNHSRKSLNTKNALECENLVHIIRLLILEYMPVLPAQSIETEHTKRVVRACHCVIKARHHVLKTHLEHGRFSSDS